MTKKELHNLYKDPALSAEWAGLIYTSDEKPGITRKKAGTGFYYLNHKGDKVTDEKALERIKKLVIPPAWTEVWIAKSAVVICRLRVGTTKGASSIFITLSGKKPAT
ncbi:hypothetical protein [Pontibacter sp. BAB1700]|uniref:hypothetical protein n=1 Tax=Pontibacter sp. BAB1700 TaxID=1144253 RepID=UPI0002E01D51|nr:hypothetical protein [Pontibacter sp. BAB1700]